MLPHVDDALILLDSDALLYCMYCIGLLISCDVALKAWLIHQDSELPPIDKFIIADVDETHLFIKKDDNIHRWLIQKIDEWHDSNAFLQTHDQQQQNNSSNR
jgi:hypothetical protein